MALKVPALVGAGDRTLAVEDSDADTDTIISEEIPMVTASSVADDTFLGGLCSWVLIQSLFYVGA